jgi:tRNA(Ile)-lysidine synthase
VSFNSRTLLAELEELERITAQPARFLVAFSGGLDSTALLHAVAGVREQHSTDVVAVHIDHQLQADSSDWARHCETVAAGLDVEFICRTVQVDSKSGRGMEAAARDARYAAFHDLMRAGDCLLSAHHRDDQAETLLLNLMRGSGPTGLAGIPAVRSFGEGWLWRPLLGVPRSDLEAYAREHELQWLEDPSNATDVFDRNFLRQEILPRLEQRWPGADKRIVRSAELARDAAGLLAELADIDLRNMAVAAGRIDLGAFDTLSKPRQRNLLRQLVANLGLPAPPAAKLESILEDLVPAREDAAPLVCWPGAEVRRYRGHLFVLSDAPPAVPTLEQFVFEDGAETGLSAAVMEAGLELRFREGGEEIRPLGQAHTRTLKNLLQEEGVLPWMRERLPLLYSDGRLVAVADLWIDAASASSPGTAIRWPERPQIV